MPASPEELAREQEYFDRAAAVRDKRLDDLRHLVEAAADKSAATALRKAADAARERSRAGRQVAVGRIDSTDGKTLYVGHEFISGPDGPLVINWQAPAATPFHKASHADPLGLAGKRTYTCQGNAITDFTEVFFGELAELIDRDLLAELLRARSGELRDIVATIQAAQHDLISAPLDQVLVMAGGPGTGKTVIALHRVSWLLFNESDRLRADQVLIVGPHPTFTRYIANVLPSLGDDGVRLAHLGQLVPDEVRRGPAEAADVTRLKGDARMADLLLRALADRVGAPEPAERLLVDGRFVTLPGADIHTDLALARQAPTYAEGRAILRARLAQRVAERTGAEPTNRTAIDNLTERLWPQLTAPAFLRDLLGSRPRLLAAAEAAGLTPEEASLLHRRGAERISQQEWSPADIALLDECAALINGVDRTYAHIVVDEAQDLSPMQLRSVARRSATGSLTLVGDLAQSTGPWAKDSWDEVTRHLPTTHPTTVAHLRYGYRVPRQVYEYAAQLLPVAAPTVTPPEVVRDGPADPGVHVVDLSQRAGRAVTIAMNHAAAGRFVGIVCPLRCRREVEAALRTNNVEWSSAAQGELGRAINLVSPDEAKGLEFDAVVVVEPVHIVAGDARGHRLLYVALTRTTTYLDIVSVDAPVPLSVPDVENPPSNPTPELFTGRDASRLAQLVADRIRQSAPPQEWAAILRRAGDLLENRDASA